MLKLGEVCQLPSEGKAKAYSTWYSQAVSHPSTNQDPTLLSFRDQTRSGVPGWYGRKRIQCSRAGYLKKTHRGCISERFKNKSAMPVFNRNQIKSKK